MTLHLYEAYMQSALYCTDDQVEFMVIANDTGNCKSHNSLLEQTSSSASGFQQGLCGTLGFQQYHPGVPQLLNFDNR